MSTHSPLTEPGPADDLLDDPGAPAESGRELAAADFEGRCAELAESLLGTLLLHETPDGPVGGVVVETEAYLGVDDPACHCSAVATERTRSFLHGPGTTYVYSMHGHAIFDVISEYGSYPECVLVRALHPACGVERMEGRRGKTDVRELTSGPGKLTEALGITRAEHDVPIDESPIGLYDLGFDESRDFEVASGRRVGVSGAEDWPLRFCVAESPCLSRPVEPAEPDEFDVDDFYSELDASRRPEPPDR